MAALANQHPYLNPLDFCLEPWFQWSEAPAVNHFCCFPCSLPKLFSPRDLSPGIFYGIAHCLLLHQSRFCSVSVSVQEPISLCSSSSKCHLIHSSSHPPIHSFPGSLISQRLRQPSCVVWLTILPNAGPLRSVVTQSMTCTANAWWAWRSSVMNSNERDCF